MYDVIIIGAGLAGLSAAKELHDKGVHYKILEANSRPGGKVLSKERSGQQRFFELGPQFFNEDMTELWQLLHEAGIEVQQTVMSEEIIEIDDVTRENVTPIINKVLEAMQIDSSEQDQSLYDLFDKLVENNHQKKIVTSYLAELQNSHPKKLSSKAVLDSSGRYLSDKSDLTHQAAQPLSRLIRYLACPEITYQERVVEIVSVENHYKILTENNEYVCKAVIVALPPTVASRVTYTPPLPNEIHRALTSYRDGEIIKITWVYERTFWQHYEVDGMKKRLNGVIYTEPLGMTVVDSTKVGDEPRLTMFIGADAARKMAEQDQVNRNTFTLELLEKVFGKLVYDYVDVEESIWIDHSYCGGGYSAKVGHPGVINAASILRKPYHQLIFACSEISPVFPNFMEGAIRSGQGAARSYLQDKKF